MTNDDKIEESLSSDASFTLTIIKSDKSLDEKLKQVKNFIHSCKCDNNDNQNLKDLISIYFLLEAKHPVKSLIQNYLNQVSNEKSAAIEIFMQLLLDQIVYIQSEELMLANGYKFVSYINELSQNFEIASLAIGKSSQKILPFLNSLIQLFIKQLRLEISPSKKSETSHCLHNCFQVYIFSVRCYIRQSEEKNHGAYFVDQFEMLIEICNDIFEDNEVRIETKNIFAMLIVMRNNFLCRNDHMLTITEENQNIQKRLCLMAGVIQAMNDECIDDLEQFCIILKAIYLSNTVDNTTVYTVSRILMQINKKLLEFKSLDNSSQFETINAITVSISFLNLEHNVESVRFMSKESIKTMIELGSKISDGKKYIDEIFTQISLLPVELKASAINAIHSVLTVKIILEKLPDILVNLLSSIDINKENKISCYLTLSNKGCKELSFMDWYEIFIEKMTKRIQKCTNQVQKFLLNNLLLKCIKKDRMAIQMLLKYRNDFDVRFNFMLLNLAKEEGVLQNGSDDRSLWKVTLSYDEIRNAMVDIDVDVRLSAIYLIVDTKKVTDEFLDEEIETLIYFFENNINLQISSTKQTLIGSIKKIFARIRSTIQSAIRKANNSLLKAQFDILVRFHEFAINNLKADANYSRRSLSLVLLLNIHELIHEYFLHEIKTIWTQKYFSILHHVLYDSYENNKEKALELMTFTSKNIIQKFSKISLISLEELHKSIKPADSLTASYLILFCLKFSIEPIGKSPISDESLPFKFLIWCENHLENAIDKAESSIIVAAGSNPMYGFINSIRSIINTVDLKSVLTHSCWKTYFNRLISISNRLTKIASPIVNDSSPEGIYPRENIHMLLNAENEEEILKIVQNTTSQMILLCAWRIIKENSLLLGDLSLKASKICGSNNELFTINQLIDIGDHFLELLSNIKHRGAFEQCFAGFSQYCSALTTSDCLELNNLPSKILQNILNSISHKSDLMEDKNLIRMKNLCATRRSAGLPFIIQALLSSEIKISKYENFHYTMKNLLDIAQNSKELEMRIHSLNILRVLYRCKELNDVINEYICQGLKCSILGCGSQTWSERNSSTLLFSALMIRTFGVQRNKDTEQIDIKNKMSSKIFFLRYPELYDFFLDQLNHSANYVLKNRMDSKLYPLLLILNRLFTSPSENCESNLRLINFIPTITLCSGCIDLKARVLCAKFVANVNPINGLIPRVLYNIQIISEIKDLSTNFKHGRLLEILYLIKNVSKLQIEQNLEPLNKILIESFGLLGKFRKEVICFSTVLDFVIHIFQAVSNHELKSLVTCDQLKTCFEFDREALFGVPAMQTQLIIIELIQMQLNKDSNFLKSIKTTISYHELLQKLNCIILILSDKNQQNVIGDEYEIDLRIRYFIERFSLENYGKIRHSMVTDDNFLSEIAKLTMHEDVTIQGRSYEILSLIDITGSKSHNDINILLVNAVRKPDDYKIAIIKFMKSWMQQNQGFIHLIDWKTLAEFVDSSYYVKLSIIDVLKLVGADLCKTSLYIAFYYTIIILTFLMGDDSDICEEASRVVSSIIGTDQVYIGSYATDLFIKFLTKELKDIDKNLLITTILFVLQKANSECQDEEVKEFQIFEKSESNNTQEWFVIRNILLATLRPDINSSIELAETVDVIENFCKEIGIDHEELVEFLKKLNSSK